MINVYLDSNVDVKLIKKTIKNIFEDVEIKFLQWPVDKRNKNIKNFGLPAGEITWSDDNLTWEASNFTWADYSPTEKYECVKQIVGKNNRRDCIHFDIAIKNKCQFFLTEDKDFLQKRDHLEALSGIKIFDPSKYLDKFIDSLKNLLIESNLFIENKDNHLIL
jgi:hypothetical protein